MNNNSTLTFEQLKFSDFGNFVKIVWNNKTIFDDTGDCVIIDGTVAEDNIAETYNKIISEYLKKKIYSFHLTVVDFHHTVVYIEGEN